MQYILLIYEDESVYGLDKAGPVMNEVVAGGAGLQNTPTATTVRTSAGGAKSLHDGPFAETKEQLGGFYLIEADDLDEAIAIAKQIPLYGEGAIEIRPLLGQGQRKAS